MNNEKQVNNEEKNLSELCVEYGSCNCNGCPKYNYCHAVFPLLGDD